MARQTGLLKRGQTVRLRATLMEGKIMRIAMVLAASSALALAACSGETTVEDPSDPEELAAATDSLPTPQPGMYTDTAELVEVEMTGGTPEEQEMMNMIFQPGSTQETQVCRTEEDTAGGAEDFLETMNDLPDECEMESFTVDGGSFEANMDCAGGAGESGNVQVAGTMTETSSDVTMTMNMESPEEGRTMRMVIRTQSERTGDCEGETAAG